MEGEEMEESGSGSEIEWEEVEATDALEQGGEGKEGSLEIVVSAEGKKKGKRKACSEADLWQKAVASFQRELRLRLHQTHLLCLLARGMLLSQQCEDPALQSFLLSVLGASDQRHLVGHAPSGYSNVTLLKLLKWFLDNRGSLHRAARESGAGSGGGVSEPQLMVALLRCLGLRTRLVMVLHPLPPLRAPATPSSKRKVVNKVGVAEEEGEGHGKEAKRGLGERLLQFNLQHGQQSGAAGGGGGGVAVGRASDTGNVKKEAATGRKSAKKSVGGASTTPTKKKGGRRQQSESSQKPKGRRAGRRSLEGEEGGAPPDPEADRDAEYAPSTSQNEEGGDEDFVAPRKKKRRTTKKNTPLNKLRKSVSRGAKSSLTSDLPDDPQPSPSLGPSTSREEGVGPEVEFIDAEETGGWAEVLLMDRKQWVCLHAPSCSVGQPQLCEKHCPLPLHYVVAFEHSSSVRDVTARYASDWCRSARRHRVSEGWWEESLCPYQSHDLMETMQENEDIMAKLKSQPLPLSVAEYKNHPLYALKRHLLKFEAIYPEDSPVLGHCKGEAVYARSSVHTLHTRDTWLKEGRLVRVREEAYRVVKARPKRGQSSVENSTVEVFGRWQTEEYMPPLVVDGKVPRNEYGNVELFKPSMLPVGGAHVKIQGIQKVARKLNIDFAPAMVGWDFHGGYSHPLFDGIVVAKENEEVLLEAWQTEEQLTLEKDIKKREKRVLERWRRLVRGVVIRERVKLRFDNINS